MCSDVLERIKGSHCNQIGFAHLLGHWASVYNGHLQRTCDTHSFCRAFSSGNVTISYNNLGVSRSGFETQPSACVADIRDVFIYQWKILQVTRKTTNHKIFLCVDWFLGWLLSPYWDIVLSNDHGRVNGAPVSQQVRHDKDPLMLPDHMRKAWAKSLWSFSINCDVRTWIKYTWMWHKTVTSQSINNYLSWNVAGCMKINDSI